MTEKYSNSDKKCIEIFVDVTVPSPMNATRTYKTKAYLFEDRDFTLQNSEYKPRNDYELLECESKHT